jgi:hypothetical protein
VSTAIAVVSTTYLILIKRILKQTTQNLKKKEEKREKLWH